MEEHFARVETKYLLTAAQAAAVERGLLRQGFRRMDFGSPRVQSLYYDTEDFVLIRASLERPVYKEKLRLRAYGEPGTISGAYLEIKKKYRGVVYKRRTALPLREAMDGLTAGELPVQARSDQVYELPCTATLSPGVSVLDLLVIASKKSLEGMTTDVKLDARLKNGMGLPLTFKKIDLQQFTQ